ncbi:TPA: hypothetical protein I7730_14520 [Vibrio vulnificus]|uniref:Uncharacterized protein n=1 Tax=Vibrio vulnificus TaxID=672 RepID=A0A8H9N1A7_VIBVL|nr:hypothetical protein [Vibrio vulnificus]HAS8541002.1 hypothetical protein [Vibrio vulnificus]
MSISNKLTMILSTSEQGDYGKNFYTLMQNVTAEEWISLIQKYRNSPEDVNLRNCIQYLVYCYNKDLIEEIASKTDYNFIGSVIVEAWASIFNMSDNSLRHIDEITRTPVMLHVLEGHMLNLMCLVEYDDDINLADFVVPRIKKAISDLSAKIQNIYGRNVANERARLVIGTGAKNGVYFPPISDYDIERVEQAIETMYLVQTIEHCVELLKLPEDLDSRTLGYIEEQEFEKVLDLTIGSRIKRNRASDEFDVAFEYMEQLLPKYIQQLAQFFFDDHEVIFLRSVAEQYGCVTDNQQNTTDTTSYILEEATDSLVDDEIIDTLKVPEHNSSKADKGTTEENESSNWKKVFESNSQTLVNFINKAKLSLLDKPKLKDPETEPLNMDDVIHNSSPKKRSYGWILWLIVFGALFALGNSYMEKRATAQDNSIIEKAKGSENRTYQIVKSDS